MKKAATYALTCLLLARGTQVFAQSSKKPSKPPQDRPKPAEAKTYENAENKFRFKAPDTWQSAPGGCAGSIYNLAIPPDFASLPKPKPGQTLRVHGDLFTIAANPASSADADLSTAVAALQEQVKKDHPAAEFKPLEKAKVAGLDASVLTATMPAKSDGEPKLAHRYTVFQRDGKVFQINLYGHANTVAKQTSAVQKVIKSFEWTDPPAAAAAAFDRKGTQFRDAVHGLQLQLPVGWESGELSMPGAIAVFFPPDEAKGSASLFTRDPQGKDAEAVLKALQGEIRDHDANATFDPTKDATLGGEPARLFTYKVKLADGERSGLVLAAVHAGKGYVLKYSGPPAEYEKHVAAVHRMIDSFRWAAKIGDGSNGKAPATRPAVAR